MYDLRKALYLMGDRHPDIHTVILAGRPIQQLMQVWDQVSSEARFKYLARGQGSNGLDQLRLRIARVVVKVKAQGRKDKRMQ